MKMYLIQNGILCKQYQDHVKQVSQELKEASLAPFRQQQLVVQHVQIGLTGCVPDWVAGRVNTSLKSRLGWRPPEALDSRQLPEKLWQSAHPGGRCISGGNPDQQCPLSIVGAKFRRRPTIAIWMLSPQLTIRPASANSSSHWNNRASTMAVASARYARFNQTTIVCWQPSIEGSSPSTGSGIAIYNPCSMRGARQIPYLYLRSNGDDAPRPSVESFACSAPTG
jgi:hypothetical protein